MNEDTPRPLPSPEELAEQGMLWDTFRRECHAKGACEFSGLRVSECVRSICDCFETEEGAAAIEAAATEPLVDLMEP